MQWTKFYLGLVILGVNLSMRIVFSLLPCRFLLSLCWLRRLTTCEHQRICQSHLHVIEGWKNWKTSLYWIWFPQKYAKGYRKSKLFTFNNCLLFPPDCAIAFCGIRAVTAESGTNDNIATLPWSLDMQDTRIRVQPLIGCRPFSCLLQGGVHHSCHQEGGSWRCWCPFISSDFQLTSAI